MLDKLSFQSHHVVCNDNAGKRIDQILTQLPEIPSRSAAKKLLKNGSVLLNGVIENSPSKKLKFEDTLQITLPPPESKELLPEEYPLEILFEDEHVLVLNKPARMVVHPAQGHTSGTLVNYLLHHCKTLSTLGGTERSGIVHRLDKDTSGVMIVAKNDYAHKLLAAQFKRHSIERKYKALVWGKPNHNQGWIDAPLGRHPKDRKRRAIVDSGKHAVTHWRILEEFSDCSLLECELETGRTHQIRVHLSSIGLHIIGDPTYGRSPQRVWRALATETQNQITALNRQALHAGHLGFVHPRTKEFLEFSSPLPEDFQNVLERFRH